MTDPLAPLRKRFSARALEDLSRLKVLAAGDLDGRELRTLVHNLAGAAGTFGHAPLSEAAAAIDDGYAAGRLPSPQEIARLEHRLMEVSRADA